MQSAPAIPDHLARLNPAQRLAVEHQDGPLLVIAGAGTGKTSTLVHRVAHLLIGGADPRRILLLTFSRRAAAELARRVGQVAAETLGPRASVLRDGLAWSGTFHAIGARLLRDEAGAIGLDPAFTIQDREDSADLMALARHRLGLARGEKRFPAKGTCLAIYSRAVNAQASLAEVMGRDFPWCVAWEGELAKLFEAYVEAKQAAHVLDYDDLLLYWAELAADPDLGPAVAARFDHVLVDEYQDTNRLQAAILARHWPEGRGLTVVGDDAQSIYAFRAAEVRNILDFPARFTPRARVVTLEQNYRSTAPILAAANAVIAEAREGYAKRLASDRSDGPRPALVAVRDEAGQVDHVCRAVLAAREEGVALTSQAVLFRTASHSAPLEVELVRRNIPFVKFGGLKFLDAAHVKDLLSILRLAENPRDTVAGFRALQLVAGAGPASAEAALAAMARSADPAAALAMVTVPARAQAGWAGFAALFGTLSRGQAGWPDDLALARAWYEPQLERLHEDAPARRADLLQLEAIAGGFAGRRAFLTDVTLDPPDAASARSGPPHRDEDYLVLSTIHSAKGQEWKRVFVLNVVDGCIPSDLGTGESADIEEERRLLYVAMTRARDELHLVVPQQFFIHGQAARGDRHVHALRSRFITEAMLPAFERRIWPPAAPAVPGRTPGAPTPARDFGARMRGMWTPAG